MWQVAFGVLMAALAMSTVIADAALDSARNQAFVDTVACVKAATVQEHGCDAARCGHALIMVLSFDYACEYDPSPYTPIAATCTQSFAVAHDYWYSAAAANHAQRFVTAHCAGTNLTLPDCPCMPVSYNAAVPADNSGAVGRNAFYNTQRARYAGILVWLAASLATLVALAVHGFMPVTGCWPRARGV